MRPRTYGAAAAPRPVWDLERTGPSEAGAMFMRSSREAICEGALVYVWVKINGRKEGRRRIWEECLVVGRNERRRIKCGSGT